VHNERKFYNNKLDKIIRENEKRTCTLIDVAILVESVIFTDSAKRINHHPISIEMLGTELLRVCSVFYRMKEFWTSCS